MDVYVREKRMRISPTASIGKGGEADVFDLGSGIALKLWKGPEHADIKGLPEEERAAAERLLLVQDKMRAFPKGLPDRVVSPIELATDKKNTFSPIFINTFILESFLCYRKFNRPSPQLIVKA